MSQILGACCLKNPFLLLIFYICHSGKFLFIQLFKFAFRESFCFFNRTFMYAIWERFLLQIFCVCHLEKFLVTDLLCLPFETVFLVAISERFCYRSFVFAMWKRFCCRSFVFAIWKIFCCMSSEFSRYRKYVFALGKVLVIDCRCLLFEKFLVISLPNFPLEWFSATDLYVLTVWSGSLL